MLHITNGTEAMNRIHELGLPGYIVTWDDVLHEGPVPQGQDLAALRKTRAAFLASAGWGERHDIEKRMKARDETLQFAPKTEELVLWFEHDLYDQLQLLQVLDALKDRRGGLITMVLPADYIGYQTTDRLREWLKARARATDSQFDLAIRAWDAFRAPEPRPLLDLLNDLTAGLASAGSAESTRIRLKAHAGAPLPSLPLAIIRLLQQYPSMRTGLSRTEALTLSVLASGPLPLRAAFTATNQREEVMFMGDQGWWLHVRPLLAGPRPLVGVKGSSPEQFSDPAWWSAESDAPQLALTEDGTRVLAGKADHVALNGIDRWLGGVHLEGPVASWRWNDATRWLVPAS